MQPISCLSFRRLYATIPEQAAVARTLSTPRAVRLRRLRKGLAPNVDESDATPEGLTPTEDARYKRLLAVGGLGGYNGRNLSEKEWLSRLNERRSRIRGIKEVKKDHGTELTAVGQAVYLPNVTFRLVRNHTLPGQSYNPYEATFRIPQSVTKTDVRSYLHSVYGVKTTYIRTDNYLSPIYRSMNGSWTRTKSYKTYKRAVVGLVDPFYFPLEMEAMEKKDREDREKWIEEKFGIKQTKEMQKVEMLRMTKSGSKDWKWRGSTSIKRSNILKLVAERRAGREELFQMQANRIKAVRERAERKQHSADV